MSDDETYNVYKFKDNRGKHHRIELQPDGEFRRVTYRAGRFINGKRISESDEIVMTETEAAAHRDRFELVRKATADERPITVKRSSDWSPLLAQPTADIVALIKSFDVVDDLQAMLSHEVRAANRPDVLAAIGGRIGQLSV